MARKRRLFFVRVQSFLNFVSVKKFRFKKIHFLLFAIVFSFISVTNIFPVVAQSDYSQSIVKNKITPNTLVEQGKDFYDKGDFSEAIDKLKKAKEIFKIRGDKLNISMISSNLSLAYQQIGEWNNAENEITESINLLKSINGNSKDKLKLLASALEIQGKLQLSVGKPKQALIAWKDAANKFEQADIQQGEIRSKINQSLALQELGRYREAYKILAGFVGDLPQQSQSIQATAYRVIGNAIREAGLVDDEEEKEKFLSLSLLLVKEYPKEYEKLLRLKYRLEINPLLKLNYIEISRVFLQRSLNIYKGLHYKQAYNTQLKQDIAETYFSLGNTERAAYYKTKDASQRIGLEIRKYDKNTQLKLIQSSIKYYEESEKYYEKSEQTATASITKIQSQLNKLSLLIDVNKRKDLTIPESIKTKHQKLLSNKSLLKQKDVISKLPSSQASIYAAINLAKSLIDEYADQNNSSKENTNEQLLKGLLNNAVEKSRKMGDKRIESYALGNLAHLYESQGDLKEAQEMTVNALQLAEKSQDFDITYQWQWQLGRILKKQGQYQPAIAAYKQATKTVQNLRQDLLGIYNPDIKFTFRDNIEPVYQELIELLLPYPKTALKQIKNDNDYSLILDKNNLNDAIQVVENLQVLELETFMRCNLQNTVGVAVEDIAKEQDLEAAIMYPIILDDRIEVLLKLPKNKSISRFTTVVSKNDSENNVESSLKKLESLMRDKNPNKDQNDKYFKEESQKLYKWLFKQENNSVENELKNNNIKTLVFVLGSYSNALRNIPIAALYDKENNQYLIQKDYGIALNLGSELIKTKALNKSKLNILAAGVSEINEVSEPYKKEFPGLPSVVDELYDIENDKTFKSTTILREEKFTPEALKESINSKPFGIVHLATHGEFSSSPDDTFILAYKKHINVNLLGNLLRSRQEKRTEPIELLVLSACETANGDKRASLGIAGVSVKVGARSIVASLFGVNDKSAYELIKTFYKKLGDTGMTRAEALRYAQNELLDKGYSVYDWAPFVLVGNWS